MKVLMATNSVNCSRRLVAEVQRLLAGKPLEVVLVGVEVVASGLERVVPVAGVIAQEEVAETRRGLAEAEALLTAAGASVETVERRGRPGPEILAVAEACAPDLIVMGAQDFGPIARALLGSVSTHVVHHWLGATLVIREAPQQP